MTETSKYCLKMASTLFAVSFVALVWVRYHPKAGNLSTAVFLFTLLGGIGYLVKFAWSL